MRSFSAPGSSILASFASNVIPSFVGLSNVTVPTGLSD